VARRRPDFAAALGGRCVVIVSRSFAFRTGAWAIATGLLASELFGPRCLSHRPKGVVPENLIRAVSVEFRLGTGPLVAVRQGIQTVAHEGWTCPPYRYDDGGFTGGNMERPALKRLLADIEAGKVDCVVVCKVDRLSRSLLDFARMMETFDKHRIAFVSVTQQFNTASSMGRLVLNVLLSFAQFERDHLGADARKDRGHAAQGHMIGRPAG
jgi:hypothetical protein